MVLVHMQVDGSWSEGQHIGECVNSIDCLHRKSVGEEKNVICGV